MTEQMQNKLNHIEQFDTNYGWTVSANDIYLDLALLTCDCFRAKLVRDDDGLKILFDNGQKFIVDVKEI